MKTFITFLFIILICRFQPCILQAETKEDINIAALFPLSGPAAAIGQSSQAGAKIAVDEINLTGGINNRKIKLIIEDSQTEPRVAVSAYQRLLNDYRPEVTLSALSSVALALRPIAEKTKTLLFAQSVHPALTEGFTYILRNFYTIDVSNEVLVRFIKEHDFKRVGILHAEEDWGQKAAEMLQTSAHQFNGKIVGHESFEKSATDLRAQILRLKEKRPDIIYLAGIGAVVGNGSNQIRELGMTQPIVIFLGCYNGDGMVSTLARKSLEGSFSIEADIDLDSAKAREVAEKTKKYTAIPFNHLTATQYDVINILSEGFKAGIFTSKGLRDYVIQRKHFTGLSGNVEFSEDGNSRRPMLIRKITGGQCF